MLECSTRIKLIIFDLDNTLVDMSDVHYFALNEALEGLYPELCFSYEEHLAKFNGRPTKVKLEMLGLKSYEIEMVNKVKQEKTLKAIKEHIKEKDYSVQRSALLKLKEEGYMLYCASNSVRATVHACLNAAGYYMIDAYFSNEEVGKPKPHSMIFLKAMIAASVNPSETLILEDSTVGIQAVLQSGAWLCHVKNPLEVTYEKIKSDIRSIESSEYTNARFWSRETIC